VSLAKVKQPGHTLVAELLRAQYRVQGAKLNPPLVDTAASSDAAAAATSQECRQPLARLHDTKRLLAVLIPAVGLGAKPQGLLELA